MRFVRWLAAWTLAAPLVACTTLAACNSDDDDEPAGEPAADTAAPSDNGGVFRFPDGDDNIIPVSVMPGPEGSIIQSIEVAGDYVYACTSSKGLYVGRIVGPAALDPVVQGAAFPDGAGCRETAKGPDGAIYFAGQSSTKAGSWIVQASTTKLPGDVVVVDAAAEVDSLIQGLAATDTWVAAVLGEGGLVLFERGGTTLPEASRLSTGFDQALGLAPWGSGRLVVANGLSGLAVVDVSDPANPFIEATIEDNLGTARRVQVVGDRAFVAEVSSGISIVDLVARTRIGDWETHEGASSMDVFVEGDLAYVANWEDLVVLDVSDPTMPRMLGSEAVAASDGGSPHAVAVRSWKEHVLVADWSAVLAYAFGGPRSAPDIRLSRGKLDFGMVTLKKKGQGFVVQNLGDEALHITQATVDSGLFTVTLDPEGEPIQPRQKGFCQVVFEPKDGSEVRATLTLATNDPDEAIVEVPLSGNVTAGVQVGGKLEVDGDLFYQDHKNGNEVTVSGSFPGKVVIMAYFATW